MTPINAYSKANECIFKDRNGRMRQNQTLFRFGSTIKLGVGRALLSDGAVDWGLGVGLGAENCWPAGRRGRSAVSGAASQTLGMACCLIMGFLVPLFPEMDAEAVLDTTMRFGGSSLASASANLTILAGTLVIVFFVSFSTCVGTMDPFGRPRFASYMPLLSLSNAALPVFFGAVGSPHPDLLPPKVQAGRRAAAGKLNLVSTIVV